ncbi:MAG: hypothetical protein KAH22_06980 [Thiotrichaceae bacterium]|nr:hypothetical protein [Thiotrichaceae bacterium]
MGDKEQTLQGFLLGNVGAPFIIGLAVGYFAKKAIKIALFFGGLAIIGLFVAEYYGFAQVSNVNLTGTTEVIVNSMKTFGGFLTERLSHISSKGLSSVAGFAVGIKFG